MIVGQDSRLRGYVALALVVLSVKPSTVTLAGRSLRVTLNTSLIVADYIHCVRRHLITVSSDRHRRTLESCQSSSSWKDLFDVSRYENLVLKHKIAEVEATLAKCSCAGVNSNMIENKSRKRRSSAIRQANTQSKRVRLEFELDLDDSCQYENDVLSETRIYSVQELVSSSISQLSRTQACLSEHHQRMKSIDLACQTIRHTIEPAVSESKANPGSGSPMPTLAEACHATRCIWPFVSTSYLSLSEEAISPSDVTVIQMNASGVLQCLMDKLDGLCIAEAQRRIEREDTRRLKSTANTKSNLQNISTNMQDFQNGCSAICSTAGMLLRLASDDKSHRYQIADILSGILLDRVGLCMSTQLFLDARSDEPGHGLAAPRGVLKVEKLDRMVASGAAQLAAPYLAYLLRKLTPEMAQTRGMETKSLVADPFAKSLKEKMQNTLLQGIFSHDDQAFSSVLQTAAEYETKTRSQLQLIVEHDINEKSRLLEEVWSYLGWDILMQGTPTT